MAKSEDVVDLVLHQIKTGRLKAGDRLPTHRDMAWNMTCSVGTVTRAYAELERRGLTYGQVGRGTYVFGTEADRQEVGRGMFLPTDSHIEQQPGISADLSLNSFYHPDLGKRYRKAFSMLAQHELQSGYRGYFDGRGRPIDRHYAARWMKPLIGSVPEDHILITQGAQSGLYLAMAALASPGDSIATEAFGYPGIKAAAQELGLRLSAIEMDEQGMIPAAFEAAAKRGKIKLLVTVPTNHNPTGTTVPEARRREIIEIAIEHKILILEDGVYGPLQRTSIPTYYELCPEISLYLTSFSKVFSPGLRVGYLVAPEILVPRLATRLTAINWMTSPITLDILNYLLEIKEIDAHQSELVTETNRRFRYAAGLLKPWLSDAQLMPVSPLSHLWLQLPPAQNPAEFIELARQRGVALMGGHRFMMNRQLEEGFIRICLMGVADFKALKQALHALADILAGDTAQSLIS